MPKTPFRTPNDPLIVTPGDLIRGEDDTAGTAVLVRGGNSTGGDNVGGSLTLQGGAGDGTGAGGPTTLSAGTPGAGGAGAAVSILATSSLAVSGVGGSITVTAGDSTGVANAGSITLTPGVAAGSGADGILIIGNSSALQFTETTTVPGPTIAATQGRFWVRDDTPNVPVFTDDAGTDWVLNAGGGVSRVAQSGVLTEDLQFFLDFNNQSSWTPNQTTTWTDTIANLAGTNSGAAILNGHLNFDGGTDVVNFGTLPTALEDLFAGGGTFCAWVRVESDGGGNFGHVVDTRGVGSTDGWVFYTRDEGIPDDYQFSFQIHTTVGGPNVWETTDRPLLNQWVFVAMTFDSDNIGVAPVMYLDGESVAVTTIVNTGTGLASDAGNDLLIGNRNALDRGFDGDIEIIALYDEVKSPAEIRDIYRAQSPRFGSVLGELSSDRATDVRILGADTTSSSEPGGDILIQAGTNAAGVGSARGGNLTMRAGSPLSNNGAGGAVLIEAGDADGINNANGGGVTINGGDAVNNQGQGGAVTITGGTTLGGVTTGGPVTLKGGLGSPITGRGGDITIEGGDGVGGGDVTIASGEGAANGTGGDILIVTNSGTSGNFTYGSITIQTPDCISTNNQISGSITIQAGQNGTRNVPGSDVIITAGDSFGGGANRAGDVVITAGDQNNAVSGGDGGDIILNPGSSANATAGEVRVNGKLTVTGLIDPTGLVLDEQASVPFSTTAGFGTVWVRNDSPNVLVFTNDAGDDHVLVHRVYWVGSCGLNDSGVETFLSIQGDGAVLASQGQQTYFHAPADMVRFKVELRSTVASPGGFPGNTTVRVYRNRSGTASATVGPVNISADTTYEWAFSTASIVAGDLFSIGITPTTGAGEFQVSITFEYDWSTV